MQFTFEQVATLLGMLAALGVSCWRIVEYVNREIKETRAALHEEIEFVRARYHDLANEIQKTYAEKDDVERLERLVLGARNQKKGGDE
jgi:hypothetical protein